MKRRFKSVWIKQSYLPNRDSKTVYFPNHNMWWDGLLPLYLSRKFFNQPVRAMMEDKQIKKYKFFPKIGAFSVNLSDSRSVLKSLRYAIKCMERDRACLFIYPEGELTPTSESKPTFKKGLAWLFKEMDNTVDFVPIAFYSHTFRDGKPELYINIGDSIELDSLLSKEKLTTEFEIAVHQLLVETREVAGFGEEGFTRI
ncbi:MAG: lysophospholipid acyltransferase family protein [Balneola sp.]